MNTYSGEEFRSLIRLLDDENITVREMAQARLLDIGERIVPELWDIRDQVSLSARESIDGILSRLSRHAGKELALEQWRALSRQQGEPDLETGVVAIARSNYPDLNWTSYRETLDTMADELFIRLTGVSDPHDTVEVMTRYLFREKEFYGPPMEDYDPDDSYMNRVLERRRGLPISLSALCLLIGKRLSLPLVGIGLPGHFIMAYRQAETEILFDPYHQGMTLNREECEEMILKQRIPVSGACFDPYTNRMILARMLNNLRQFYLHRHDRERLATVTGYFNLVMGDR